MESIFLEKRFYFNLIVQMKSATVCDYSLVKCILHRHLNVAVRAHSLRFDEVLAIGFEVDDIHFEVRGQSTGERKSNYCIEFASE